MARLTPVQMAEKLRKVKRSLPKAREKGDRQASRLAYREAVFFSTGTFSLYDLAAQGHPYGFGKSKGAIPYGNPGYINVQEGPFSEGWVIRDQPGGFSVGNSTEQNGKPIAVFLKYGTKEMMARPIEPLIKEQMRPVFRRTMKREITKAFR